jgi:hypothetical protein
MEGERRTSCYESPVSRAQHAYLQAEKILVSGPGTMIIFLFFPSLLLVFKCGSFWTRRGVTTTGPPPPLQEVTLAGAQSIIVLLCHPSLRLWPRGRSIKLFLALATTAFLGSESRGIHEHILLYHDPGSRAALLGFGSPRMSLVWCRFSQSDKLLLAFASTVTLGSENPRESCPYFTVSRLCEMCNVCWPVGRINWRILWKNFAYR